MGQGAMVADPGLMAMQSDPRASLLLDHCPTAFVEVDTDGVVVAWNRRAEQHYGWPRAQVIGRPAALTILPPEMGESPFAVAFDGFDRLPSPGGDGATRTWVSLLHRLGHRMASEGTLVVLDGPGGRTVAAFLSEPVPAVRRRSPTSTDRHDAVTGLPGRDLFAERMAEAVEEARGRPGAVAVVLLDLDRFKAINETMGHEAGDRLLVAVADRLVGVAGNAAMVARFGGDEFLALFLDPVGQAGVSASAFVERVQAELTEPFDMDDTEVFLDASVGLALNTFGVDDAATLLSNAESAMYRAKRRGGSSVETFGESMRIDSLDRMATEHSLHRALERSELQLHYQPVVEIGGATTVGVEALVRWHHPAQGLVGPYRFIPVAEESGLIIPIGAWVLEQACTQLRDWHDRAGQDGRGSVDVNLSARQIDDPRIIATVEEILARTGLPPEHLTLEITESALMSDATAALGVLRALKSLGVVLAIDDFGTGYSSLSYLQRFPLDILKVDQSFVDELGESPEAEEIVSAVIGLAHALGLKVVAEGVETKAQLEVLRAFGCDFAQGYLFSKPLPASEVAASFGLPVSA